MSAGYVALEGNVWPPILTLSRRVGGPLSTMRAEAASLLQFLRDVAEARDRLAHLLIFVDCLVILEVLMKWGRSDYHPRPREIVHVDILRQLLIELRTWTGRVVLVKIKSHSGCLLNELADDWAARGLRDEGLELFPGPQKYGSL